MGVRRHQLRVTVATTHGYGSRCGRVNKSSSRQESVPGSVLTRSKDFKPARARSRLRKMVKDRTLTKIAVLPTALSPKAFP